MKLGAAFSKDLGTVFKEVATEIDGFETRAMTASGQYALQRWRQAVLAAQLGPRVANATRLKLYPRGQKKVRAALIYTKAPNIVEAFALGVTIRSKAGFFLAVPLPAAGQAARGKRMTPGLFEKTTGIKLRLVYRRKAPSLLVADNARLSKVGRARTNQTRRKDGAVSTRLTGRTSVPVFVLLPQVNLRKRLDLDAIARDADGYLTQRMRG